MLLRDVVWLGIASKLSLLSPYTTLLCYFVTSTFLQHHVPTKVYYYYPPPTAEIQKSWRKVDFSRISRFREAGWCTTPIFTTTRIKTPNSITNRYWVYPSHTISHYNKDVWKLKGENWKLKSGHTPVFDHPSFNIPRHCVAPLWRGDGREPTKIEKWKLKSEKL